MILTPASGNMLSNPGFEAGSVGSWQCAGPSSLFVSSSSKYAGNYGGVLWTPPFTVSSHAIYQDSLATIYRNRTYYAAVALRANTDVIYQMRLYAEGEDYLVADIGCMSVLESAWTVHRYCFRPQSFEDADTWSVNGMLAVGIYEKSILPSLYIDDAVLCAAVDLHPSYKSRYYLVAPDRRVLLGASNAHVAYAVGSSQYRRYELDCDFVAAVDRNMITSWWESGVDLMLWRTETLGTSGEVYSMQLSAAYDIVRIVSEEEPLLERRLDRRGYYSGRIVLETVCNV